VHAPKQRHGRAIRQWQTRGRACPKTLPSNLYTHSILNLVYQTYEQIGKKNGSILNLTTDEIVAQLIQHGLVAVLWAL
jgi:hypothetical protein